MRGRSSDQARLLIRFSTFSQRIVDICIQFFFAWAGWSVGGWRKLFPNSHPIFFWLHLKYHRRRRRRRASPPPDESLKVVLVIVVISPGKTAIQETQSRKAKSLGGLLDIVERMEGEAMRAYLVVEKAGSEPTTIEDLEKFIRNTFLIKPQGEQAYHEFKSARQLKRTPREYLLHLRK